MPPKQVAPFLVVAFAKGQVFGIADGEVDLDRVILRNRSEDRRRVDKVAYLQSGLTRDTTDE